MLKIFLKKLKKYARNARDEVTRARGTTPSCIN